MICLRTSLTDTHCAWSKQNKERVFLFHRDSIIKQHINEYWRETKTRKREDISVLLIFLMHGSMLTLPENIAGYSYFTSVFIINTVFQGWVLGCIASLTSSSHAIQQAEDFAQIFWRALSLCFLAVKRLCMSLVYIWLFWGLYSASLAHQSHLIHSSCMYPAKLRSGI